MEYSSVIKILLSQYRAALGMLRDVTEKVPDTEWNSHEYNNPNRQLIYHTIWSAKLYLSSNYETFVPFVGAIEGAESLGGDKDWENPEVEVVGLNSKQEILEFIQEVEQNLESSLTLLPLYADSGFEWYPYSRLELHLNTIRHIQHHTAQVIERLKAKGISGFPWWIDQNKPAEWL